VLVDLLPVGSLQSNTAQQVGNWVKKGVKYSRHTGKTESTFVALRATDAKSSWCTGGDILAHVRAAVQATKEGTAMKATGLVGAQA
jgi:hypothetical protein